MVNGLLCTGNGFATGVQLIDFLSDSAKGYRTTTDTTYQGNWRSNLAGRNLSSTNWDGIAFSPTIVSGVVNDIAMTVLPNAPTDPATGLPVPTIAVATNGGVSVIKDDGTVINRASQHLVASIRFRGSSYIYGDMYNYNGHASSYRKANINTTGSTGSLFDDIDAYLANSHWVRNRTDVYHDEVAAKRGTFIANQDDYPNQIAGEYVGSDLGVTSVLEPDAAGNLSVAYITSDYNTGYMVGDIKLATLSDTDDTDVVGTELVTNGTFDSDLTGWTLAGDGTVTATGGYAVISWGTVITKLDKVISGLVAGKRYVLEYSLGSTGGVPVMYLTGSPTYDSGNLASKSNSTLMHSFTAIGTTQNISMRQLSTGTTQWDNISIRLAEEDRSANGNGLQVFGTVTKTPVATGADLVGYSGFSSSNKLIQPYNQDLNFGTGDWCYIGWVYKTGSLTGYVFDRANGDGTARIGMYFDSGNLTYFTSGGNTNIVTIPTGVWLNYAMVKRSGVVYAYLNGELKGSFTHLEDITNDSNVILRMGSRFNGTEFLTDGSLALFRISATAPSAKQIAKIYEDEKVLFQENAQATLYGTSNAVTALAYDDDTELLHVGTSAGRSIFQGLQRMDNTTDAVGVAISASNGLVAED